ncbi:MAG TPA: transposase [Candidatus Bathyarchaeia archaeon]|nr:transposase [Candidatus Bathyarchaeia archaeon]
MSPPELFIAFSELVRPATTPFYAKLDQTLASFDFATQARSLCAPAYSVNGRGRPGIDPVVYFKMLMVGFFEDIASERGIAERCSDSISIRAFLGYDLTQATPDHSTLSIIRQRLGEKIYDEVFLVILSALDKHGLLKGKNVGIDASVIQANAALKSLINRDTEEAYWEYVRRLASENGIDPKNAEAVRQFDRKRPKKMSNEEWVNPHDPDAKIGPTKAGATDMIYKPEHTVDLDTGAILRAEVRLGHETDQKDLLVHVLQAQENINQAQAEPVDSLTIESTTADKGYHAVGEMKQLQAEGIRTVISDPVKNRRSDNLDPEDARVVRKAKRSAGSKSGKELLRRRGMHLERSFAHILDAGGARRTTLRGLENLNKRFKVSAAIYNLSQLMRKLFGVGTPKQLAAMGKALFLVWRAIVAVGCELLGMERTNRAQRHSSTYGGICFRVARAVANGTTETFGWILRFLKKSLSSTGC